MDGWPLRTFCIIYKWNPQPKGGRRERGGGEEEGERGKQEE